jgi:hypothetical protein
LPTEEDLLSPLQLLAGTEHPRTLQLAARSIVGEGLPGYSEGAGAFVQADGNVLVAPNGYPVYTSVHMNPTYFATARKNLIATGDYQKGTRTTPSRSAPRSSRRRGCGSPPAKRRRPALSSPRRKSRCSPCSAARRPSPSCRCRISS